MEGYLWEGPERVQEVISCVTDPTVPFPARVFGATLLLLARLPGGFLPAPQELPATRDDADWTLGLITSYFAPEDPQDVRAFLDYLMELPPPPVSSTPPTMLTLLAACRALQQDALTPYHFGRLVCDCGILHPAICPSRPRRHIHPLWDYFGFSQRFTIQMAYRELVDFIWPLARSDNWSHWQWVTVPGGPDLFPRALQALRDDEITLPHLHELRYAPLPPDSHLHSLLHDLPPHLLLLVAWLRDEISYTAISLARTTSHHPVWDDKHILFALAELSGERMAQHAYAALDDPRSGWLSLWHLWLGPMRQLITLINSLELPQEAAEDPARWIDTHLWPGYRRICANLLLPLAACEQGGVHLLDAMRAGDLAALRACGLLATPSADTITALAEFHQHGTRPQQAAARMALERIAQRKGLGDPEQLLRQLRLATAWDLSPLGESGVRAGWQVGPYRLRVSLHGGKAQLEITDTLGAVLKVPKAIRESDIYREARAVQRETQTHYQRLRADLERAMLAARPISVGEWRVLWHNPIFAHLAQRLIWQTAEGTTFAWVGPERWERVNGEPVNLDVQDPLLPVTLILPHALTLAESGELTSWQAWAATQRFVQPFKQLFREHYHLDAAIGEECRRFAGYPLTPQRAYAILRAASFAPGRGVARRQWSKTLTAHLCWAEGAQGHDLFGPLQTAAVTSGGLWFTQDDSRVPLADVPPILLSECLRVADLLTARAAADEALLSSSESARLRGDLLRELARSLGLSNLIVPETGDAGLIMGVDITYRFSLLNGAIFLEPDGRQVDPPLPDEAWTPEDSAEGTSAFLARILALAQHTLNSPRACRDAPKDPI